MVIRHLKHFAAVAETLHFGRAATRLGMTQPPLSQSILALEAELGAPLFVRTKRSVALTPFGEQWLPHVRDALAVVAELPGKARQIRDGTVGALSISFVSTADYSVLPLLVRHYSALYPDIEITLTEATSDIQIEALVEGSGHAGIVIPPPSSALPETLDYMPLVSEPLIAAVPEDWLERGHRQNSDGKLQPEELIRAPLIIFPRRTAPAFHDLVTGYYAAHGTQAHIAQEAIQMQTIISLVSAGMGIALVPASLRNLARTGVRYMELAEPAPVLETGLVWRRMDATPTLERFIAVAREMTS